MHHWIETVKPINHSSHAIIKFWERVSKAILNSRKGRTTRQRLQTPAVCVGTAEWLVATARWSLPRFAMFRLLFLHHDVYFTALFHCKQKASFSTSPPLLHSKPKVKQNTKPPQTIEFFLRAAHAFTFPRFIQRWARCHTRHPLYSCVQFIWYASPEVKERNYAATFAMKIAALPRHANPARKAYKSLPWRLTLIQVNLSK